MDTEGEEYTPDNPWQCLSPPNDNGPTHVSLELGAAGVKVHWTEPATHSAFIYGYKVGGCSSWQRLDPVLAPT